MVVGIGIILLVAFPKTTTSLTIPQASVKEDFDFLKPDLAVAELLYEVWLTKNNCSCVQWVRPFVDFPPIGKAKNLKPNTDKPEIGIIGITNESSYGHLVLILEVGDDHLHIAEANYKPCQRSQRILSINDPKIIGYYK